MLVLAAQLEILQAGAVTQGVVSDGKDVVGLVIGEMNLQELEALVEAFDESEAAGEQMESADAAGGNAANTVADLIVNVAGGEDGLGAAPQVRFIEASFDPPLAVTQLTVYSRIHLKILVAVVGEERVYSSNAAETPRVFEFFPNLALSTAGRFAYSRTSAPH
jgi:hypothetical protein